MSHAINKGGKVHKYRPLLVTDLLIDDGDDNRHPTGDIQGLSAVHSANLPAGHAYGC